MHAKNTNNGLIYPKFNMCYDWNYKIISTFILHVTYDDRN